MSGNSSSRPRRARVHVFGMPEDTVLQPDERLCTTVDGEQMVVFHVRAVCLAGPDQDWQCTACGYCTAPWRYLMQ
jgi:hypothetical protein